MKPKRSESFFRLTEAAWRGTASLLFRPFRWGVWWRLLFIAFLSGQLGAGWYSLNLNTNLNSGNSQEQVRSEPPKDTGATNDKRVQSPSKVTRVPQDAKGADAVGIPVSEPPVVTYESILAGLGNARKWGQQHGLLIAILVTILLTLQVLGAWLAARFAFVFIDGVVTRHVEIIRPFKQWGSIAHSYFKWSVVLLLILWLMFGGLVWASIATCLKVYAKTPTLALDDFLNQHAGLLIGSLLGIVLMVIVGALLSLIFWVWLTDFVLPIMYQRRCTMLEAWKRYLRIVRRAPWEAAKYLLWRSLIAFAIGVAYAIVCFITILLFVLVVGLLIAIGVLMAKALPVLKIPLILLGVLLIAITLVAFFLTLGMLMVPPSLLFRTFSLEYLRSLHVGYDLLPEATT